MDSVTAALMALNGTLIGALVWALKTLITRLFGNGREDQGVAGAFLTDLQQNTQAIRELRDYQREHARAQAQTTETLSELLQYLKIETAKRDAGAPH